MSFFCSFDLKIINPMKKFYSLFIVLFSVNIIFGQLNNIDRKRIIKSEKNKKVNLGGSYHRKIKEKYKKPKTQGDKGQNRKRK